MTHAQLLEAIRNKKPAQAVDIVLAEVLRLVEPFVSNQWGGDVLLKRLRALKNCDHV